MSGYKLYFDEGIAMRSRIYLGILLTLTALIGGGSAILAQDAPTPEPTLTLEPTLTPFPTATDLPTLEPTFTPFPTPEPTLTPSETPTLEATMTLAPTPTASATATGYPTPTPLAITQQPQLMDYSYDSGVWLYASTMNQIVTHIQTANNNPSLWHVIWVSPGTYTFNTLMADYAAISIVGKVMIIGHTFSATNPLHPDQLVNRPDRQQIETKFT